MHNPVNHPLRPFYRALGALAGAWFVLFGIAGLIVNAGDDFFAAHPEPVLGQGVNLFGSLISLVTGAILLIVTALGRNRDTETYKFLGWAVLVVATYGLATSRTDGNVLGFTIATVMVDYLVGLVLIAAGLYSKTAPSQIRESTANEVRSA
jgi:4-amino-4-deoxy-L-arabinose transferase-like glycosyltransferase